jgi:nucleotide-binding universal stress UspA family protein
MNDGNGVLAIRRILVAVDAAPDSVAVLETAAVIAAGLNAELRGIFVEDINLLRLAGLPFTRELAWSSATELHLDYQRMERVLRGRGAHARQAIVSVSSQLKLHGSLQVVRGHVVQELLQAAANVDLIILGKGGRAASGIRIGSVALRIAQEAACPVLLLTERGLPHQQAVMTTFTGQTRDELSLSMASRLARLVHGGLLVVIPAATQDEYVRRQQQAHDLLREGSLSITYQSVKTPDARFYQRLAMAERVGLAVLDLKEENDEELQNRLAVLPCSVLLLR